MVCTHIKTLPAPVGFNGIRRQDELVVVALLLKRASLSRPSGEWNDDDFDVLADGVVVGRILKVSATPVGTPWMWTLAFGQHEDRCVRGVLICARRGNRECDIRHSAADHEGLFELVAVLF
jgi:hypothetical protein